MTSLRYRIVGGSAFERDELAALAPAELVALSAGGSLPAIALLPFPERGSGADELAAIVADLTQQPPSAVLLVLTGLDRHAGFRAIVGPLDATARQAAYGVEDVADPAAALVALLGETIANFVSATSDPGAAAAALTLGADAHAAQADLAATIQRIAALTQLHGVYIATLRREPATFARLLGERTLNENVFAAGLFDRLPRGVEPAARRSGRGLTAALCAAGLIAAAALAWLPLERARFWNGVAEAATSGDRAATLALLEARGVALAGPADTQPAPSAERSANPVATAAPPAKPVAGIAPLPDARYVPPPEFDGAPAQAYGVVVRPACEAVVTDAYPFFSDGARQASTEAFRTLFMPGGVFDSFTRRLAPHIARDGPVWRWKAGDPAAAAFDADTADVLARAAEIGTFAKTGARFSVTLLQAAGGVDAVQLAIGARRSMLKQGAAPEQGYWRPGDADGESVLQLMRGGRPVHGINQAGAWGLLQLVDQGRVVGGDARQLDVTFGDGVRTATLRFSSDAAIFGRGGLWAFRCPAQL